MYRPSDASAWPGRIDGTGPDDLRWHQVMQFAASAQMAHPLGPRESGIAIIGFCSDEGVRRNGGRVGAVEGPAALRKAAASLPVHFEEKRFFLVDAGNVICQDGNLEEAQAELGLLATAYREAGYTPLIWGGGHEVAYGAWLGLSQPRRQTGSVAVINFDAHFDLRNLGPEGSRHSGNSFTAMQTETIQGGQTLAMTVVGLQRMSNTRALYRRSRNLAVQEITAEDMALMKFKKLKAAVAYPARLAAATQLTICLDVFSASVAPGVSAPAPLGILPDQTFIRLLRHIIAECHIASIDLAELNPSLDHDGRTARLAAAISFEAVQAIYSKFAATHKL